MAIIMGAPIAPSLLRRHEGCWLPRLMFSRVLFPALMEAGAGKQNAVVIVVRRYARLAMVARLGSLSYLCSDIDNCPLLAIIDGHGYTLLPLRERFFAIFLSLKICNPFL